MTEGQPESGFHAPSGALVETANFIGTLPGGAGRSHCPSTTAHNSTAAGMRAWGRRSSGDRRLDLATQREIRQTPHVCTQFLPLTPPTNLAFRNCCQVAGRVEL